VQTPPWTYQPTTRFHHPHSIRYRPPFLVGPMGFGFAPPLLVIAPGGGFYWPDFADGFGPSMVPLASPDPGFGVAGPLPPPAIAERWNDPPAKKPKRSDPARAGQLVTLGDRLFRSGNTRRAADRYEQAARADPKKLKDL